MEISTGTHKKNKLKKSPYSLVKVLVPLQVMEMTGASLGHQVCLFIIKYLLGIAERLNQHVLLRSLTFPILIFNIYQPCNFIPYISEPISCPSYFTHSNIHVLT